MEVELDSSDAIPLFIVDRRLPGLTREGLMEVQRLLTEASRRVSQTGDYVRYVRCTLIPDEGRCICLFQARSLGVVRRVNEIAQVPFGRICRAVEFAVEGEARVIRQKPVKGDSGELD